MTLFALRSSALLAVRFAVSPAWETQAAVQALADERASTYHQPWLRAVRASAVELDLAPLAAALPRHGYVPDFLAPPPRHPGPRFCRQLAEIRATPWTLVERELARCRETAGGERLGLLDSLLADPQGAGERLAALLQRAWSALVAPFWTRVRTLLDRDVEERSRMLARHGLRRVLDGLYPRIRWTDHGLWFEDGSSRTVEVAERGLVLMPSAYLWPQAAAVVEEPWAPALIYPVRGVADLWRPPASADRALERLLGRTRALVLAALNEPLSTTALAALAGLSPAGASRHLLALRDAGLVSPARHGHEVRYRRTDLGSALLRSSHGWNEGLRSRAVRARSL